MWYRNNIRLTRSGVFVCQNNAPVTTAAPTRQPVTKEIIITTKPATKVTEKPNRIDVELEDNNMDILVKE